MSASTSVEHLVNKVSQVSVSDDDEPQQQTRSSSSSSSATPFLDQTEPNSRLANFVRDELDIGRCLDGGRFTETREIKRVERSFRYQPTSMAEEKARLEICNNVKTKGRANFSIKRVKNELKTTREIERAALGLTIEANYLSRLEHPNIVQLRGMCQSHVTMGSDTYEYHAIITNRITETLDERIDYWNEQDSIAHTSDFIMHLKTDYAFQIADALTHLHDRRIVFRNLNLSSIGFTTNDTIQLLNFDCVKEIPQGQSYLQDGFKGSQTYMPLEMYESRKYDYKVDCYAWAICFYEMLTQEPAFQATKGALVRENGWCPSLEDADFIPDGLLDLMEDAWETDLDERFTMKEVRGQLEWILFGDGEDEDDDIEEEEEEGEGFEDLKQPQKKMEASTTNTTEASSSNFLNFAGASPMDDFSALGLDLDESVNFDFGGFDPNINAALGFSGTTSSFLPGNLLLDDSDDSNGPPKKAGPPPAAKAPPAQKMAEEIIPKIQYTQQYRGLRLETIPPLSFIPANANKGRRRSSIQRIEKMPAAEGGRRRASIQRTELAPCA